MAAGVVPFAQPDDVLGRGWDLAKRHASSPGWCIGWPLVPMSLMPWPVLVVLCAEACVIHASPAHSLNAGSVYVGGDARGVGRLLCGSVSCHCHSHV